MPSQFYTEFQEIVQRMGHYLVHIHRQPGLPCPRCLGEGGTGEGREPNPRCPQCLGLGEIVTIAPQPVMTSPPPRLDYAEEQETEVGILGSARINYYMQPGAAPNLRDLLVEVTWSVPPAQVLRYGQVVTAQKVYEANSIFPYQGVGGELLFYKLGAHDLHVDLDWLCAQLQRRPTLP